MRSVIHTYLLRKAAATRGSQPQQDDGPAPLVLAKAQVRGEGRMPLGLTWYKLDVGHNRTQRFVLRAD